jgi:DNA-binding NtrC family response regulator
VVIAKYLLDEIGRQRSEEPKKLTSDAIDILARHRWPGNVRELDNVLRAASLFSETEELCPDAIRDHILDRTDLQSVPVDRPSVVKDLPVGEQANSDTLRLAYDEIRTQGTTLSDLKRNIERECIRQALTESNGNITRAADLLGMKRPRLSQLVKQYGLLDGSWEDVS